ncbi:hypothetical protein VTN77DRAFT_5341 [Rasamsonia byssochlamydoides]|uniref:uncharacterized protein n=1 Tax=Rasamsonia byssochlamydoides TaxID=89139 RepID=UPI003743E1A4
MPSTVSEDQLCESVLDFVTKGAYPDSEDVVASEFPASALPEALHRISKAREQAEKEISSLSEQTASDVDGWISQARQLHADIERSRETAREIVAQHEKTKPLQLKIEDASRKVHLLQTEIAFNEAVTESLEQIQEFRHRLDAGHKAVEEGRITDAIESLEDSEKAIETIKFSGNGNLTSILSENISALRNSIIEFLRIRWACEVRIDKDKGELYISDRTDTSLERTIESLSRLNMLDAVNKTFQRDLLTSIIYPILQPPVHGESHDISVGEFGIRIETSSSPTPVSELFDRVDTVLGYLQQRLPVSISKPLSEGIVPVISSRLINSWLSPAIPIDLDDLNAFEKTLGRVMQFCQTLEGFGWHGQEELVSWVNQVPRLWLTRRRVDSLDQVRKILTASKGLTRKVERVEKEIVSSKDDVLLEGGTTEDWDAGWGNENEESNGPAPTKEAVDEEDVSAWGLEDETEDMKAASEPPAADSLEDDDAGDAWGWGEDEDDQSPEEEQKAGATAPKHANGQEAKQSSSPREITLTEHYTVTDIPDSILALIRRQISDSEALSKPEFAESRASSSGTGLLALPTLILAMFKATAPSFYTLKLNAGQIYLYNDSMYLAEQIRHLVDEHQLSRLAPDIEGLERFGKLSYSKEMQTQRTIVTDLLDGSQGFAHCSEQPFLGECENAIDATVDRIRHVYREWQSILSHSALLQAIGSLLSTVINKVIIDIEDLSDISEAESQRLVSFCNKLSKLEDIFMPETAGDKEPISMVAVYVRNWLKFQYLINILESSLADIKFLWLEGELSLEFTAEEVIELIEALFAESDHRRRAITEIRRSSRAK